MCGGYNRRTSLVRGLVPLVILRGMRLSELLDIIDKTSANLAKLTDVWERARPMIPDGGSWSTTPAEFDDLARAWTDLVDALPPIGGVTVVRELPDPDTIGHALIDLDPYDAMPVHRQVEEPGKDLAEYRYRLSKARRTAIRQRVDELSSDIDVTLPKILEVLPTGKADAVIATEETRQVREAIAEIERLVGDTVERRGRWGDLSRHLGFSEAQDWEDIAKKDWPDVKRQLSQALFDELEPLPVPKVDIAEAAESSPTGGVVTELAWDQLSPADFERLLFNLLPRQPGITNVQWLTHPNAADRGRDLSADRIVRTGVGVERKERIIVQAKHWLTKSVGVGELTTLMGQMDLWQPPTVHTVIVATSGAFSSDATSWVESRNNGSQLPHVEMWNKAHLESLLANAPGVSATFGL